MKLNQIFCKHIWKQTKYEITNRYIRYFSDIPFSEVTVSACYEACLKCKKERITEQKFKRELLLDEQKKILERHREKANE